MIISPIVSLFLLLFRIKDRFKQLGYEDFDIRFGMKVSPTDPVDLGLGRYLSKYVNGLEMTDESELRALGHTSH